MDRHEWKDGLDVIAVEGDCVMWRPDGSNDWHVGGFALAGALKREILRLAAENRELKAEREQGLSPFRKIGADRLADEVASLVARGLLDSRSAAADALLDYREPPRTPRSDRLARLDALLASEAPPEDFRRAVYAGGEYLGNAWRWLREQLTARHHGGLTPGGSMDPNTESTEQQTAPEQENAQ